jgi:hypothetical protein
MSALYGQSVSLADITGDERLRSCNVQLFYSTKEGTEVVQMVDCDVEVAFPGGMQLEIHNYFDSSDIHIAVMRRPTDDYAPNIGYTPLPRAQDPETQRFYYRDNQVYIRSIP